MRVSDPLSARFCRSLTTASALALAIVFNACAGRTSGSGAPLPAARAGFPVYVGVVSVDPASQSLRARWRISFVRTARMADSVTLLLNEALVISRVSGRDVASHSERVESGARRVTIRFDRSPDGAPTELDVEYAGVPRFGNDTINGIGRDWVELGLDSYWHPVFDDYAHSITARVRLDVPPGWAAVASGSIVRLGDALVLTNDVPLIDVAFVASPALTHSDAKRVSVYHAGTEANLVAPVLQRANACADYLDARYGTRQPLPPVKIVVAPRGGPGYARKNYIVITRGADTNSVPLARFVCHELAHYWSSGAISSGPENWLNEAFAEFVSARYVRTTLGDSAYLSVVANWRERAQGARAIWTPTTTTRPSARTAYGKAPLLLHRLEERVGPAVMERLLVRFMTEPLRTTAAVIEMVGEVAGVETQAWFREQLAE